MIKSYLRVGDLVRIGNLKDGKRYDFAYEDGRPDSILTKGYTCRSNMIGKIVVVVSQSVFKVEFNDRVAWYFTIGMLEELNHVEETCESEGAETE